MNRHAIIVLTALAMSAATPLLVAQAPAPAPAPSTTQTPSTPQTPAATPPSADPAQTTATQGKIIQRVLVKVNGDFFTQKELEQRQVQALRDKGQADLTGPALYKALEDSTPDILVNSIDEMLLVQRGRELGYKLSDEQFKDAINRIKTENKLDDAGFKLALTQENMTLDELRETLDKQFVIQTLQQKEILAHMSLTEEEARQYYDKHPDEFMKPATVMLREIVIIVPAATETRSGQPQAFAQSADDAAREKIVALRERANQGEEFEKLVAEASQAASKSNGGLIGPVNLAEMSTGIRDAIEKMKPGDVTQPIRTTRGYQLLKLESRSEAERMPFDGVRDEIAQKVGEARLDVETNKYLRQLRTQGLIEWKRDDLRQMYEKRLAERDAEKGA
jgi:peptidyl-prolyl cis-trans isomerase SurA